MHESTKTDSNSLTQKLMGNLKRFVVIVIGNRTTIRRGTYSGLFASFPVTLLIVIYFLWVQDVSLPAISLQSLDFSRLYGIWYVATCLSLSFIVMGGRAIGWLITRPLASVLCELLPNTGCTFIWACSSALVWTSIALLITQPLQRQSGYLKWVSLVAILALALAFGALGGKLSARASTEPTRDHRELVATGGTVTGSSLVSALTIAGFFSLGEEPTLLASTAIAFALALSLISFLCALPYFVIMPLSTALLRTGIFQSRSALAYTLTSTTGWTFIGIFFSANANAKPVEYFLPVVLFGLCGACGGLAISQLKQD